jgi:N-acetylmuramoyl-L-alanine amidase-like protein/zinc carboxypeptidase
LLRSCLIESAGSVPVVSASRFVRGALVALAALTALPGAASAARTERVGTSAQGRAITALRVGSPSARRIVLVVGEIHGTERAGIAVTRRLRSVRPPRGTALLLIDRINPDGAAKGTRHNARGVDLNRNFPFAWHGIGKPFDTYYPGPAPLSEPESLAATRLISRVRPRVTIWFHQMMRLVDRSGGDRFLERLYSRRSRLPYRTIAPLPGTATRWQNHTFPKDTAFVVELPAGSLSRAAVRRHASAVRAVAAAVAPPRVVSRPIPFGARRRAEMRAYARRHYGIDDYRLRRPKVIVEHYTASNSFNSAFQTFASDSPDVELHELPGVCAHYLIDSDGTIAQLVPTTIMCRHTVGLNQTAIGIEHVGTSDAQVLGRRRQLQASLRLTRMLQGRYGIKTSNVIGHAESLSSPFHRERVAALRRQTHGDMRRSSMRRYRRALSKLAAPRSLR